MRLLSRYVEQRQILSWLLLLHLTACMALVKINLPLTLNYYLHVMLYAHKSIGYIRVIQHVCKWVKISVKALFMMMTLSLPGHLVAYVAIMRKSSHDLFITRHQTDNNPLAAVSLLSDNCIILLVNVYTPYNLHCQLLSLTYLVSLTLLKLSLVW